jgi:hypothetical protein
VVMGAVLQILAFQQESLMKSHASKSRIDTLGAIHHVQNKLSFSPNTQSSRGAEKRPLLSWALDDREHKYSWQC